MWAWLNAVMTVIAMLTFIGIVWWAWSRQRAAANQQAAMLPFALPDETENITSDGASNE